MSKYRLLSRVDCLTNEELYLFFFVKRLEAEESEKILRFSKTKRVNLGKTFLVGTEYNFK
jgi:hypothetical protein